MATEEQSALAETPAERNDRMSRRQPTWQEWALIRDLARAESGERFWKFVAYAGVVIAAVALVLGHWLGGR